MSESENKITEHEGRISRLETEIKEVRKDVGEIMSQVSNHLPTQITRVQASLNEKLDSIVETVSHLRDKEKSRTAVREFLTQSLKLVAILAGLTVTVVKIIEVIK